MQMKYIITQKKLKIMFLNLTGKGRKYLKD